MAKHILIPCKTCQKEHNADQPLHRTINQGILLKEDEAEAEFRLVLSCGHTVDFAFAKDEKEDVMERLHEAEREEAAAASKRSDIARAAALRRQSLEASGGEDPSYVHHHTGEITKQDQADV